MVDGRELNDSHVIAITTNDCFSTIGSKIANSMPDCFNYKDFFVGNFPNSFFFHPTKIEEVVEYITSLKNKRCSVHCLPTIVFKQLSHIVAPVLIFLIDLSISRSIFPKCLKIARVVPLFKGGDRMLMESYRPISVLNIFSKIVEKHAFKYLYSYLER